MKKSAFRLSWYTLIPAVLTICIGVWWTAAQAEEQPAAKPPMRDQTPSIKPEAMSEPFKGTVVEVLHAGRHLYVHIDTGKRRLWVAVPAFDGKPGDEVIVPSGVPVADFQSKTLNRKFKMIIFVGAIHQASESEPK